MKRAFIFTLLGVCATASVATKRLSANEVTVLTDADAGVRIICRNDEPEEVCLVPRGADHANVDDWSDHPRYIRVHDQNALDVGYWHFNLQQIDPSSQVAEARFQLDTQSNSWGDTNVSVYAIMDPSSDWDLNALPENEIIGENAPQSDYDSFAWTGDPGNPQRFNSPTPFLDEGQNS